MAAVLVAAAAAAAAAVALVVDGVRFTRSRGLTLLLAALVVRASPPPGWPDWPLELDEVVTVMFDKPASDCVGGGPTPLADAMMPETDRGTSWLLSEPVAEPEELNWPRAELTERNEDTDTLLRPSSVEAGSGS